MFLPTYVFLCVFSITIVSARRSAFIMDERHVCIVKTSCLNCLKMPQCSWCETNQRCFSRKLPKYENFCPGNATHHHDYGFSIQDNAECLCNSAHVEQRCYPPGITDGPECSGRGTCVCGRCVCSVPFPAEPNKDCRSGKNATDSRIPCQIEANASRSIFNMGIPRVGNNTILRHRKQMVMGEYCEFDNFSCTDPKCDEGPYLLDSVYKDSAKTSDIDIPTA